MIYVGAPKFIIGGIGGTTVTLSSPKTLKAKIAAEGEVFINVNNLVVRNLECWRKRFEIDWEYLTEADFAGLLQVYSNIAQGVEVTFYPHSDNTGESYEVDFEDDIEEVWAWESPVGYSGVFKFVTKNPVNMGTGGMGYMAMVGA